MSDLDAQIRAEVEARRRGDAFGATTLDDELYGGAGPASDFVTEIIEGDADDGIGGSGGAGRTGSRVGSLAARVIAAHGLEDGGDEASRSLEALQAAGARYNHDRVGDRETEVSSIVSAYLVMCVIYICSLWQEHDMKKVKC